MLADISTFLALDNKTGVNEPVTFCFNSKSARFSVTQNQQLARLLVNAKSDTGSGATLDDILYDYTVYKAEQRRKADSAGNKTGWWNSLSWKQKALVLGGLGLGLGGAGAYALYKRYKPVTEDLPDASDAQNPQETPNDDEGFVNRWTNKAVGAYDKLMSKAFGKDWKTKIGKAGDRTPSAGESTNSLDYLFKTDGE